MGKQGKRPALSLAMKMGISLVCGLVAGMLLLFLRESLVGAGKEAVWKTVNDLFFQDITAQVEGLTGSAGSTGSNPMNVILNIVPSNIVTVFGGNTAVFGFSTSSSADGRGLHRPGDVARLLAFPGQPLGRELD